MQSRLWSGSVLPSLPKGADTRPEKSRRALAMKYACFCTARWLPVFSTEPGGYHVSPSPMQGTPGPMIGQGLDTSSPHASSTSEADGTSGAAAAHFMWVTMWVLASPLVCAQGAAAGRMRSRAHASSTGLLATRSAKTLSCTTAGTPIAANSLSRSGYVAGHFQGQTCGSAPGKKNCPRGGAHGHRGHTAAAAALHAAAAGGAPRPRPCRRSWEMPLARWPQQVACRRWRRRGEWLRRGWKYRAWHPLSLVQ